MILSIPLVAQFGHLNVGWIYVVTFIQSTIFIAFSAGEFAAIPSLVSTDDLVTANGRIQATFSAAQVAGPLLAGALLSFLPLTWVMAFDSGVVRASPRVSLALVRASFNAPSDEAKEATTILHDVREGLALRAVASRPAEHLADDGADQLRRRDDVRAARALRTTTASTRASARSACSSPQAAPASSSPACSPDVCASGSASRRSR